MAKYTPLPGKPVNWTKTLFTALAVYAVMVVVNIFLFNNPPLRGVLIAVVFFFFIVGMGYWSHRKNMKIKNYFIEWDSYTIKYNTGKGLKTIHRDEIKNAKIRIDDVTVFLRNGQKLLIILDDFTDVQDRKDIKLFFETYVK